MPCIHCGACVPVCPKGLWPNQLYEALAQGDLARADALGLERCGACRACQEHCPSGLALTARFREGQGQLLRWTEAKTRTAADAQQAAERYEAREARLQAAEATALEAKRQRRAEAKRRGEARRPPEGGTDARRDAQRAALQRAMDKARAEGRQEDLARLTAALAALGDAP
jgi:Na+-translocating ferredoxin:NAD+ oxidoreductase subunit C